MGKRTENPMPDAPSDKALADDFARHFTEKVQKIRDLLQCTPRYIPKGLCTTVLDSFTAVSETQVLKLLCQSKPTTCELDPLPSSLIKDNSDILAPVIAKVINGSLEHGKFCESWKRAIVRPLVKKAGMELLYENYRPVSNLSFLSKLTEKSMIQQLTQHLNNNNLQCAHQSAYKANFSTETAICALVNNIL
jgi:hypothetical protein